MPFGSSRKRRRGDLYNTVIDRCVKGAGSLDGNVKGQWAEWSASDSTEGEGVGSRCGRVIVDLSVRSGISHVRDRLYE